MIARLLPLALLLLGTAALAVTVPDKPVQVDVLVFAQPATESSSLWQDTRALPVCHAVALRDGSGAEAAYPDNRGCTRKAGLDPAYAGFSGTSSIALPALSAKLAGSQYTLLTGRQWRQASASLSPVLLRGGRTAGERRELEGTLALAHTSAGLEATLALVLTRMDGDKPQYVTLQETRVVKPGEVNYFDHPLFGVLLQVTPVP